MKYFFAFRTESIGSLLETLGEFDKVQNLKQSTDPAIRNILEESVITEIAGDEVVPSRTATMSDSGPVARTVEYNRDDILKKVQYHEDLLLERDHDHDEDEDVQQEKTAARTGDKTSTNYNKLSSTTGEGTSGPIVPSFMDIIQDDKCLSSVHEVISLLGYARTDDTETENTFFVWDSRDIHDHLRVEIKRAVKSCSCTSRSMKKVGKKKKNLMNQQEEQIFGDHVVHLREVDSLTRDLIDRLEDTILQHLTDCEEMEIIDVQKGDTDEVFSKEILPQLEQGIRDGKFKNIDYCVENLLCNYLAHRGSKIYGEDGVDEKEMEKQHDSGSASGSGSCTTGANVYDGMFNNAASANLKEDSETAIKNVDLDSAVGKMKHMKEILSKAIVKSK
ncbi:unnamed protein product [Amoebophrya sp. A25]|nr:unnamed protein product [Amoebophrya sp. A25]|eukprot:GSA25T00024095001.1